MSLGLLALSTLAATLPMLGMLWLVWWLDRYDREPLWLYGLTFLWGAIGAILLSLVGSVVFTIPVMMWAPTALAKVSTIFLTPLIEEPAKAVFLLAVMWSRHFDNMTDGFVYGAAAGLGFGMTENFFYFAEAGVSGDTAHLPSLIMLRTFYSAVMHATATSLVGAALGWGQHRDWSIRLTTGFIGLVLAMSVHAFWNGLLTLDVLTGQPGTFFGINLIVFPLEVLFIVGVFQLCLLDERTTIERELKEEANRGLIPKAHPAIIASWVKRGRTWWVPRGLDHDAYVHALTTLALRKQQASLTGDAFYVGEVVKWRGEVRRLWHKAKRVHEG